MTLKRRGHESPIERVGSIEARAQPPSRDGNLDETRSQLPRIARSSPLPVEARTRGKRRVHQPWSRRAIDGETFFGNDLRRARVEPPIAPAEGLERWDAMHTLEEQLPSGTHELADFGELEVLRASFGKGSTESRGDRAVGRGVYVQPDLVTAKWDRFERALHGI